MKRLSLLILFFFLSSCQTLPVIHSPSSSAGEKSWACPSPFLKEKYRLVHAIEARMAGNQRSSVIGITLADPSSRSVSCAIMTAEGMVLFEAESVQGTLRVNRALPPFDSESFAKNMIEDIELIFLQPPGNLRSKGYLADGSAACRYLEEDGKWIDVTENQSDGIQTKRYSSSGALERIISFNKRTKNIYQRIELQADETFDYSLLLNLIEAQPVKTKMFRRK